MAVQKLPPEESDHIGFIKIVVSIMNPSPDVLELARNYTHLVLPPQDTPVPLTYVRRKIPMVYWKYFLHEESATHILHLTGVNYDFVSVPVHDIVLAVHCLNIRKLVTIRVSRKVVNAKPMLLVENVPHIASFLVLLRWLYTNDENELVAALRIGGDEMLLGFAQNWRFWGVISSEVIEVLKKLMESKYITISYREVPD